MSTDLATTTPEPSKPPRISKQVRRACELLADGECKTVKAAAARAGVSREWLGKMLQRSHVRAFLAREASQTIASAVPRAANRLIELIGADSEHVSAKVAERILTSEGILKADQSSVAVSVDVRAGFVIDIGEPAPKVIDGSARGADE